MFRLVEALFLSVSNSVLTLHILFVTNKDTFLDLWAFLS